MSDVKWTEEQLDAISCDGNILVSAAAGSGKTAVLVEHVLKYVTDKESPIDIDRLLVVTFTNAAASGMRLKIQKALMNLPEDVISSAEKNRQLTLLSRAKICTIDSFCIDLVRNNFFLLDVDGQSVQADFSVADEALTASLKEQAISGIFDDRYNSENIQVRERFNKLLQTVGSGYDDETLKKHIFELQKFTETLPFYEGFLENALSLSCQPFLETEWFEDVMENLKCRARDCFELLKRFESNLTEDDAVTAKFGRFFSTRISFIIESMTALEKLDIDKCNDLCGAEFGSRTGKIPEGFEDFNASLGDVDAVFTKYRDAFFNIFPLDIEKEQKSLDMQLFTLTEMFDILYQFKSELFILKIQQNALSFNDIEQLALKLLIEKSGDELIRTPLAVELSGQYQKVMVDEYQDTNDLQNKLFWALSDENRSLYAVGDVKQSIYKFRRANPSFFIDIKNSFPAYNRNVPESPAKIILHQNFRSRADICGFVNFLFGKIMSSSAGGIDFGEEEISISSDQFNESMISGNAIELHYLELPGKQAEKPEETDLEAMTVKDETLLQQEARYIAAYIKTSVAGGLTVHENGVERPAVYSDFTILLRSKKDKGAVYKNALEKLGISAFDDSNDEFFRRREVVILLSILNAVSNPQSDVALAAAMTSPVFFFSSDELAKIKLSTTGNRDGNGEYIHYPTLYARLCEAAKTNEKCRAFLDALAEFRLEAAIIPADEMIEFVMNKTDFRLLLEATEEAGVYRINTLKEFARNYESNGYKGLSSFLRFLGGLKESGETLKLAASVFAPGAVNIMSIHGSKGLDFPFVIVADCAKRFNLMDSYGAMIMEEKHGIGVRVVDDESSIKYTPVSHKALSNVIRRDNISEEIRLLYVAMTRAKEKLIMISSSEKHLAEKLNSLSLKINGDGTALPSSVLDLNSYSDFITLAAMLHPNGDALRDKVRNPAFMYELQESRGEISIICEKLPFCDLSQETLKIPSPLPNMELVAELKERVTFQYPYSHLNILQSKISVTELSDRSREKSDTPDSFQRFTSRPKFLKDQGLTPAERGTAVHKFMQYANFAAAEHDVKSEVDRLLSERFITEAEANSISAERIKGFFNSPLYKRVKDAPRVRHEVMFMMELPVSHFINNLPHGMDTGDYVVVQGVSDLVLFEQDGLVVIDYKTDHVEDISELLEKYRVQMDYYCLALSGMFNVKIKECILYSFSKSGFINVPVKQDKIPLPRPF